MVVLDFRARHKQTALGRYEQMDKTKEEKRVSDSTWAVGHERESTYHDVPYGVDLDSRRPKSVTKRVGSPYRNTQDEYSMKDFGDRAPAQQHTYESGNYYGGYQTGY